MSYFILLLDDDGNEPLGVWTTFGMNLAERGIKHRTIVKLDDEEDAWRVVDRYHRSGDVWGVISCEMLARKLKTGRYGQ